MLQQSLMKYNAYLIESAPKVGVVQA